MDKNINEFLEQINQAIELTEDNLYVAKAQLTERMKEINLDFGIAKYAERIIILQAQLETLQEQKRRFNFIFKV